MKPRRYAKGASRFIGNGSGADFERLIHGFGDTAFADQALI
jgi:hypothetical protein